MKTVLLRMIGIIWVGPVLFLAHESIGIILFLILWTTGWYVYDLHIKERL